MENYEDYTDAKELIKQNYFIIVKFIYVIIILTYIVINDSGSIQHNAAVLTAAALCGSSSCIYEIAQRKRIAVIFEVVITLIFLKIFGGGFIFMLLPAVSDLIAQLKLNYYFRLAPMAGIFLADDKFMYFMMCILTIVIYIQHYDMILAFKRSAENYEEQERMLKDSIDNRVKEFKQEIHRTGLYYENMVLQDKAALSQELHDKLGHRINGSIYQLEACKMLISCDTARAEEIMTKVIDNLRTGMDDIRAMLRREKPSNQRMTRIKLANLCEECRSQYGIDASLDIKGDVERITDNVWGIILDNCCECVTNSLKYSECNKIKIQIIVLNKMIRCNVADNGKGCDIVYDGMGIQGMKHRIAGVGGIVDVNGSTGFAVNMLIPIEEEK